MMYVEWYGVCNSVVFLGIELFVDYGGVYMCFLFCFLCVVYGVGICVDVCGVVCVDGSWLFHKSGCCLLCCYIV